jgi:hypothetical protein
LRASVGSTEASNGRLARVGVVGPTEASSVQSASVSSDLSDAPTDRTTPRSFMACDDEVIPLQERIQSVGDDADLQEVYDTERQLLYVACTRTRDYLLVTSVEPASEFLDDLRT